MIACFLGGELLGERFGDGIRSALADVHAGETLIT